VSGGPDGADLTPRQVTGRRWIGANAVEGTRLDETAKGPEYGKRLDVTGDLFIEGLARRTLARRIA
jgi:hypothetical protein